MQRSSVVDPHHFVTPQRFDIAVKVLVFEHMKHGLDDPRVWKLYRRHVETRTGGREKRSWKASPADYADAAGRLFASMRAQGFDPAHPIVLGDNLNLRGGAHRIACALVLDQPVHVRMADKPGNAAPWDAAFMRRAGMSEDELAPAYVSFGRLVHAARVRLG
ncbi:MAG: hypothetical protein ACLFPA_13200 [Dichotomicrobium sp.]